LNFEQDIKLILSESILDKMEDCVNNAYPNESCGLVFGKRKQIKNPKDERDFYYHFTGEIFECIESDRKSSIAFLIENIEKLNELYYEAHQKFDMKLISIFHSHPSGNYPSGVDRENMKRLQESRLKSFKFIIWSIMDAETKDVKAYMFLNNEMTQVEVLLKK